MSSLRKKLCHICSSFFVPFSFQSPQFHLRLIISHRYTLFQVYDFLTSGKLGIPNPTNKTAIFDCLIYRGYGQRVSEHDHHPYENAHFALELGHKDMQLVQKAATGREVDERGKKKLFSEVGTGENSGEGGEKKETEEKKDLKMPFLEVLDGKFKTAKKEKGFEKLDWSAISLVQ